jgi:putative spermidine/putrescine transport system permease protein
MFRTTVGIASRLDPSLEEASMLMGASRLSTFRRVVLPLLMPGVFAGMFLVFVQSIDNVTMTLFLAPPGTSVLPLRMYAMLEQQLDPRIAAISGVLIIVSLVVLVAVQRLAPMFRENA